MLLSQEKMRGHRPATFVQPFSTLPLRSCCRRCTSLERVGIPYETTDGIADFHASGRHSYITELLRNGASITEARQLARHTDVQMTMRYTHIGLAEQAKALAALPATKEA